MDRCIAEIFQHEIPFNDGAEIEELVLSSCLVGVELEYENLNLSNLDPKNYDDIRNRWRITRDNSLRGRNAYELVLSAPLRGKELINALNSLFSILRGYNIRPRLSKRTSVHVHLDVRDLDYDQLCRLTSLYCIFEEAFFYYAGKERKKRAYCLSSKDLYKNLNLLSTIQDSDDFKQIFLNHLSETKYSALNLASIVYFGSVEFRHMKGTFDLKKIKNWINLILSLKKYVLDNPELALENIPHSVSCKGMLNFLQEVFGEYSKYITYPSVEDDMLEGIRTCQIFSFKNSLPATEKWLIEQTKTEENYEDLIEKYPNYLRNRNRVMKETRSEFLPFIKSLTLT